MNSNSCLCYYILIIRNNIIKLEGVCLVTGVKTVSEQEQTGSVLLFVIAGAVSDKAAVQALKGRGRSSVRKRLGAVLESVHCRSRAEPACAMRAPSSEMCAIQSSSGAQVSVWPCPGARAEMIIISVLVFTGIAERVSTEVIFITLTRLLV